MTVLGVADYCKMRTHSDDTETDCKDTDRPFDVDCLGSVDTDVAATEIQGPSPLYIPKPLQAKEIIVQWSGSLNE
jgi:hypothetical protein